MPIREFDLDRDYAAAVALWQASGPGVSVGRSDTPEELRKKLAHDPDLALVAEDESGLVGTILGGFDGRRGLVYHLAVAAGARGQGLGRALMAELEARLRAKGCRRCYLVVKRGNDDALNFYARLGWSAMDVHLLGKDLD